MFALAAKFAAKFAAVRQVALPLNGVIKKRKGQRGSGTLIWGKENVGGVQSGNHPL